MNEGWYALCISILKDVPPEAAFGMLNGEKYEKRVRNYLTDKDTVDMIKLRKDYSFNEIGEMYGMCRSAIYRRIQKYLSLEEQYGSHDQGKVC